MEASVATRAVHVTGSASKPTTIQLVNEAPLTIEVHGEPLLRIAYTPGDEQALVVGLCFSRGLIDQLEDFENLDFFREGEPGRARVRLRTGRARREPPRSRDRVPDEFFAVQAPRCFETLYRHQALKSRTVAAHAVALLDRELLPLAVKEDLGRHNAYDKAIGQALLDGVLGRAWVAVLTSRVVSELVQRSVRAGLAVVLSVSRPSALAVSEADRSGLILACLSREDGMFVFNKGEQE
ncbi:MAG TPA: formate dehydrogenase accessory sulfurtransferase FdhD [Myxococcota bacterium]|nr:formate dehydrogenase accessory sulfurtransferase FdhD [Myxococcota bacterium]HRY95692.1 formate dehydrogenase accessory sulfurtransferase FdhD [Myxococcota bacterium]HSA20192.1 formate dehydrogenase accessory sulfurtransferase FdhD [Myxococcota bacterium]